MTDLKVDYDQLRASASALHALHDEFDHATDIAHEADHIWGNGHVKDAMHDFAGNWKLHKEKLLGKMERSRTSLADASTRSSRRTQRSLPGMKATEEATVAAGTRTAARGQRAFNQQLKSLDSRIADGTGKARTQAIAERSALRARPMRASQFTGELTSAKSEVGIQQAAQFGGDTGIAKPYAAIRRARALYPESAGVAVASADTTRLAAIGRTGWGSGLAVTGSDKALSTNALFPGYHGDASYNEFEDRFTYQLVPW